MKKIKQAKMVTLLLTAVLLLSACSAKETASFELTKYDLTSYEYIAHNTEYYRSLEYLLEKADKIIYGEVLSRGDETEYFSAYYQDSYPEEVCLTEVKIKVLETLKGEKEDEIIYHEAGGIMNGTLYLNYGESPLQKGNKAVLFLTENNMLVGTETLGRFTETYDGCFYVNKNILNEELYKESFLTKAKLQKDEFFNFIKEANENTEINKEEKVIVSQIEEIKTQRNIESLYKNTSDAVYGEVIGIDESEAYDFNYNDGGKLRNETYIKTKVKIKVLDRIKGDNKDVVVYHQPGGEKNGVTFEFKALESLNMGDKVIILLSEGGVVLYENGLLKVNEKGNIAIDNREISAQDYILELKGKFKEAEEKLLKESEEDKPKLSPVYMDSGCYAANMFEIDRLLEETDVIIMGKASVGRNDIGYGIREDMAGSGSCYTEINLKEAKCFYNRFENKDIAEIKYLQIGGIKNGINYKREGYSADEGENVFAFLKFDGVNYHVTYLEKIKDDGTLNLIKSLIPDSYRESFEENNKAENYGNILASYLKECE